MVCQRFGRDEEKATNILNPTTKVSMQQGFYGAVGVNEFAEMSCAFNGDGCHSFLNPVPLL